MKPKSRLGRKDIFTENQLTKIPEKKLPVKPANQKAGKPENQKRIKVTFQLPENLFIQIKIKAARERRNISDLVAEVLSKWLKK